MTPPRGGAGLGMKRQLFGRDKLGNVRVILSEEDLVEINTESVSAVPR